MTTIYDIAKKTGFSPTTVSKVFNEYPDVSQKTRRKILEAAEQLGYLPNAHARTLTTKRSWTIGVLFNEPTGAGILHPYFGGVIEGFKQIATAKGYDLMFITKDIGGKKNSYLEHCKIRGIDGVVAVFPDYDDPQFVELVEADLPCVLIDRESDKNSTIYSDNLDGSMQAVEYLHKLGHREIAHIGGGDTFAGEKRLQGYCEAMRKFGLAIRPEYIVQGSNHYTVESGRKAMEELLKADVRPTAIYAAGDNLAVGAMITMREQGITVPGDISIIGFDDIDMVKYITPALTTIRQNTYVLGSGAADMLIYLIESGSVEIQSGIIPVELVVRQSCRRL